MRDVQDNTARTRPHRRVEHILDRLKISYESEVEFPPYCVDILLTEVHAALEVDGPGHSRAKDAKRDDHLLARYGLPVLHLPTDMTPEHLEISILSFLKHSGKTARERKYAWRDGESA